MTTRSTILASWIVREIATDDGWVRPAPTWALSIVIDGTAYDLVEVVAESKDDAIAALVARLRDGLK